MFVGRVYFALYFRFIRDILYGHWGYIISSDNRTEWSTIQGVIGRVISNRPSVKNCENLSLRIFISVRERFQSIWIKVTGPVSFIIFLFQLKLDSSLPGRYFFIDFDWLSYSAMKLNVIGQWHLPIDFHWFFNCPIWPARLQVPGNRTVL